VAVVPVPVLAEAPALDEALLEAPEEYSDILALTQRFSGFDIHAEKSIFDTIPSKLSFSYLQYLVR
jgi:hypothetical protein